MLKPLSPKTLEKKYVKLALCQSTIKLLHTYFHCFAHFYGVISLKDAWKVFKHYEGNHLIQRKDFIKFSEISWREPGHPYCICEPQEIFPEETTDNPTHRLLINLQLFKNGHAKVRSIAAIRAQQRYYPLYMPEKEFLFQFTEDRFYLTPAGQDMISFVENLETSGCRRDQFGNYRGDIIDIEGKPVAGKKLSEIIFYTTSEQSELNYSKNPNKTAKLKALFEMTSSNKILERIRSDIMIGEMWVFDDFKLNLQYLFTLLMREYGVILEVNQIEQLAILFMRLNNSSNLWLSNGWSPDEIFKRTSAAPGALVIGPNMKKLFESGELDPKEFERQLLQTGFQDQATFR